MPLWDGSFFASNVPIPCLELSLVAYEMETVQVFSEVQQLAFVFRAAASVHLRP